MTHSSRTAAARKAYESRITDTGPCTSPRSRCPAPQWHPRTPAGPSCTPPPGSPTPLCQYFGRFKTSVLRTPGYEQTRWPSIHTSSFPFSAVTAQENPTVSDLHYQRSSKNDQNSLLEARDTQKHAKTFLRESHSNG